MNLRAEKSVVEYIKKLISNDLSGVVAAGTAFTVALGTFLRLLWFVYESEYYSAIGIDNIHVVESEASFYSFIILVGVTLIIFFTNYFVYFCIANKVVLSLVFFGVAEYCALLGWVFVKSRTSIVEIIVETFRNNLFTDALSVFRELLFVVLLLNLYGICFGIWKLLSRRKNKGWIGTKEDWKRPENIKHALILIIVCACVLMIGAAYSGRNAGNEKKNYKVIFEQIEAQENISSRAVYTNDDGSFYIKAVLFEGEDYFVTAYTYIEVSGEVVIYFEEQEIINKTGVKTVYLEDFYSTVTGLLRIEQNSEDNTVIEETKEEGSREMTFMDMIAIILSFVAVIVSVWGVQIQKKGIVFEKRLVIYEYANEQYIRCKRIVEMCKKAKSAIGKKNLIGVLLYTNDDKKSGAIRNVLDIERRIQRDNKSIDLFECEEWVEAIGAYTELLKTWTDNNIIAQTQLFFGKEIAVLLEKIENVYTDFCYGVLLFSEEEINEKIELLEKELKAVEQEDMLAKMKRKFI